MLEISGKSKRALATVLFSYFVYTGESIFAGLAMFVPYWKTIVYIIYAPMILIVSYTFLLRESPRWQIVKGKCEEAKKGLSLVAKTNGIKIDHEELKSVDLDKLKEKFNINNTHVQEGLLAVLKSKEILKRLLVSCVVRLIATFVYYGMVINSVRLPGDKHVNFLLAAVMSYPGELIFLYFMNKFGRKLPIIISFFISSVLSIASGYVAFGKSL